MKMVTFPKLFKAREYILMFALKVKYDKLR